MVNEIIKINLLAVLKKKFCNDFLCFSLFCNLPYLFTILILCKFYLFLKILFEYTIYFFILILFIKYKILYLTTISYLINNFSFNYSNYILIKIKTSVKFSKNIIFFLIYIVPIEEYTEFFFNFKGKKILSAGKILL